MSGRSQSVNVGDVAFDSSAVVMGVLQCSVLVLSDSFFYLFWPNISYLNASRDQLAALRG